MINKRHPRDTWRHIRGEHYLRSPWPWIFLAALLAWLRHEARAIQERARIPDAVSAPVTILGAPAETEPTAPRP